jgi:hypothetical protein
MIHAVGLIIILFSMSMFPALSIGAEVENDGRKILQSCQVALEYLDNDKPTGDVEAVKFCNDYLTGFRGDENVKDIYMGERYHRGYCFPSSGITNGVLARVIVKYLQASEQEQNLDANTAIRDALAEGYPCNH